MARLGMAIVEVLVQGAKPDTTRGRKIVSRRERKDGVQVCQTKIVPSLE